MAECDEGQAVGRGVKGGDYVDSWVRKGAGVSPGEGEKETAKNLGRQAAV